MQCGVKQVVKCLLLVFCGPTGRGYVIGREGREYLFPAVMVNEYFERLDSDGEKVNYHCYMLEAKIVLREKLIISIANKFIENNGEDKGNIQ